MSTHAFSGAKLVVLMHDAYETAARVAELMGHDDVASEIRKLGARVHFNEETSMVIFPVSPELAEAHK